MTWDDRGRSHVALLCLAHGATYSAQLEARGEEVTGQQDLENRLGRVTIAPIKMVGDGKHDMVVTTLSRNIRYM